MPQKGNSRSSSTDRRLVADNQSRVATDQGKIVGEGSINLESRAELNTGVRFERSNPTINVTNTGLEVSDLKDILAQYSAGSSVAASAPSVAGAPGDAPAAKPSLAERILEAVGVAPLEATTADEEKKLRKVLLLAAAGLLGLFLLFRFVKK